jgi:hypothetical protein
MKNVLHTFKPITKRESSRIAELNDAISYIKFPITYSTHCVRHIKYCLYLLSKCMCNTLVYKYTINLLILSHDDGESNFSGYDESIVQMKFPHSTLPTLQYKSPLHNNGYCLGKVTIHSFHALLDSRSKM